MAQRRFKAEVKKYRLKHAPAGMGSWRWGVCLTFRRWLHFQMHKSGLDMNTPFLYRDTRDKKKTWAASAETIVSVLAEAGERNEKTAIVIHEGITERMKRGEPMRRIIEQLGAWLIESGYFMRDEKTALRKINNNRPER